MKKLIIKFGTSSLTNGSYKLSKPHMAEFVRQIYTLHSKNYEIIIVSSGAIAAGREKFLHTIDTKSVPSKQMLASTGQMHLMQTWLELFGIYDITIGQVLLTRDDVADEKRSMNAQNTLQTMLKHRVIPIINENDAVATEEICFGDNDNLSALVAGLMKVDLLIILTDQEGLFTADPRFHPDAQLIEVIEKIDNSISSCATGSSEGLGTGGMTTKIQAASYAKEKGITTVIASSKVPNVIIDLSDGKKIGTFFAA